MISIKNNIDLQSFRKLTEQLRNVIKLYDALEERGYNPVNQLVGYLMSGDPGYISNHKEARNKILKIDRTKILEILIKDYIN